MMNNLNVKKDLEPFYNENVDRDTLVEAYERILQFLHRYKNNIEFVTKEELVAVTNLKENIVMKVLEKLSKKGIVSAKNSKMSPYIQYYLNKQHLEGR